MTEERMSDSFTTTSETCSDDESLHKRHKVCLSVRVLYRAVMFLGDQLSGKPGNVGEFDGGQGNVGELTKSQ